jgi:hypothetical protein
MPSTVLRLQLLIAHYHNFSLLYGPSSFFTDPVVIVELDPEKVFLERKNYATFVKRQIALTWGEQFVNNLAL